MLVVGSVNIDILIPTPRCPVAGETLVSTSSIPSLTNGRNSLVPGGTGANQAVACARLGVKAFLLCRFGNDIFADFLRQNIVENQVDLTYSSTSASHPSGMAVVMLFPSGESSALVLSGSNHDWPEGKIVREEEEEVEEEEDDKRIEDNIIHRSLDSLSRSYSIACIMLQMEIPHHVNMAVITVASERGIPIFHDLCGESRVLNVNYLSRCAYLSPNISELSRLTNEMPVNTEEEIIAAAGQLQQKGARNVLITRGSEGSLLITERKTKREEGIEGGFHSKGDGTIVRQVCFPVEGVVDEAGAGDNFRAAFVVAHYVEGRSVEESLRFAAASGAVAVGKPGGGLLIGSTREEINRLLI